MAVDGTLPEEEGENETPAGGGEEAAKGVPVAEMCAAGLESAGAELAGEGLLLGCSSIAHNPGLCHPSVSERPSPVTPWHCMLV